MHELSIALSVIDLAAEESERRGGVTIRAVHLKLGPLSGVVKQSLLAAFELAREGSLLDEAELQIEEVPIVVHCPRCRVDGPVRSPMELCCRECGTPTPE